MHPSHQFIASYNLLMHSEPILTTPPELQPILEALRQREPLFHRPELGTNFAAMITDDFWEIGASGNRYSRDYVLSVLGTRPPDPAESTWRTEGHHCRRLSAGSDSDTYLLTYTLHQGNRITRRTTIWRQSPSGWQALFHQGTIVQSPPL
jgi:hypothetical protein